MGIATEVGRAGQTQWRRALGNPNLRGYAKITLSTFSTTTPIEGVYSLELTPSETVWLLIDSVVAAGGSTLKSDPNVLNDVLPRRRAKGILKAMRESGHPQVREALLLISDWHPRKRIADTAKKVAAEQLG